MNWQLNEITELQRSQDEKIRSSAVRLHSKIKLMVTEDLSTTDLHFIFTEPKLDVSAKVSGTTGLRYD